MSTSITTTASLLVHFRRTRTRTRTRTHQPTRRYRVGDLHNAVLPRFPPTLLREVSSVQDEVGIGVGEEQEGERYSEKVDALYA